MSNVFPLFQEITNFRLSLCCGEAAIPSPGGKVAERSEVGRGIREISLDVVQPEDFLKGQHFVCLIHFLCFYVSARIPLPPAVATLPPAPSPRGKVCACGAKENDKTQFVPIKSRPVGVPQGGNAVFYLLRRVTSWAPPSTMETADTRVSLASRCRSGMVMTPQLHMVDLTLYREASTLSCREPA